MNVDAVLFLPWATLNLDNDPTASVRPEQGLLAMRKRLGLFANIRPIETFDCLLHKSPLKDDIVRGADLHASANSREGCISEKKYRDNDKAFDTNIYTRPEIERILLVAYDYAMHRRRHVTVIDKANILDTSRLWRKVAKEFAVNILKPMTDYMFVDYASMRIIQEPGFSMSQSRKTHSATSLPTRQAAFPAPWGFCGTGIHRRTHTP